MSKISISEALKLVDVSKTTLYRDLKENKLSSTTDAKGRRSLILRSSNGSTGN